jgi:hypothetical protein
MLCALLVSAVAAQSASAATKGTTGTAPAGTEYGGGVLVSGGETLLHSVITGIEVEFKSTELAGTGAMENMLAGSGEHTANGVGTIEFKNVTVLKPAGKGCEVKTGEVKTKILTATTAGQGMGLLIEPEAGKPLAQFEVVGCEGPPAILALLGLYEVTGKVVGGPTEGTNETTFTRLGTTNQGTLKLRGQKAGITGVSKLKTVSLLEAIKACTVETP